MRTALLVAILTSLLCIEATAAPPRAMEDGPIQVFILAGQSNMEGAGAIRGNAERNGGQGSLEFLTTNPDTAKKYAHLVDAEGGWSVRDDVWISYFERKGGLTAGFGAKDDRIGPELGFGHVVGDASDAPVLLIKVAWGGKSLAQDFRPPSRSEGDAGPYYVKLVEEVHRVLAHLDDHIPGSSKSGYELAGFGWHQGWNDRVNQAHNDEYEVNLTHFIRDIRSDLGVEDLPFVIAETGMSGPEEKHPRALSLMRAQAAVAAMDEFKGTVAFVGTKTFYRPPEQSPSGQQYHWNSNAETYLLIGEAMGKAMLGLMAER